MITQAWLDALPFGILITDTELRLVQAKRWLRQLAVDLPLL